MTHSGNIAWPANDNTPPPLGLGKRFLAAAALALCGLCALVLVAFVL